MEHQLHIYNTIKRKKELFVPLKSPFVGLYVCGPTAYGDAHLGHSRPAITFDLLHRYLKFLGYNVRYVRNITDVGHLEQDADEGEDKIAKKSRIEQLEPMEIVQYYVNRYHENMQALNVLSPSIEPQASAHIIEQQKMIAKIIENGYAYESNGSIYFDVLKYAQNYNYGELSGRVLNDLLSYTRELDGQEEKRSCFDFSLWKKAKPEHIMRWDSPWGEGFPGWHLEWSVMSTKYLGEEFDIHGGGMDLLFPHHECEIAQNVAAQGKKAVHDWMHNNMITINGQKMGKSLGNTVNLYEVFSGNNKVLDRSYSPMTIRFFILQAHYRSTLDFSNEALQAAEKGYERLMKTVEILRNLKASQTTTVNVKDFETKIFAALNDDLNSPITIATLFEAAKTINSINEGKESVNQEDLLYLQKIYNTTVFDILGLKNELANGNNNSEIFDNLVEMLLNLRQDAKKNKDWSTADNIRNKMQEMGFQIKDKKDGFEWELK